MTKQVIIMRAPSGAGKSTWIKTHAPTATVCSADFYFEHSGSYKFDPTLLGKAHGSCVHAFKEALARGDALVVVDNTNLIRKHYKEYVELAKAAGYEVFQKCLKTQFQNAHGVPADKVAQMRASFQEDPSLTEYPV
jgi:predicted kinase